MHCIHEEKVNQGGENYCIEVWGLDHGLDGFHPFSAIKNIMFGKTLDSFKLSLWNSLIFTTKL